MLKIIAIVFCVVGVVGFIGFGSAWVIMLLAEQRAFNEEEEAEGHDNRWSWLNFRSWLKRVALRRVFVMTPATWISAGCNGGKRWQARFGLWITETYGAS